MPVMAKNLITCMLALIMAVTSVGLASARGQTHVGGQVVLCSGGRIVTVTLDINGEPMGPTHICPDMALTMMLAVADAPANLARPDAQGAVLGVDTISQTVPVISHLSRARAPPVLS